uniref:DUF6475 domain-containing protein n=1 Tax=Photorhabdus sp. RM322S TaxID=3342825 RepID=UPI0036DA9010
MAGIAEGDVPFRAKEFEKRYRSALITGVDHYEQILIGMDDAHNILSGHQDKPQPFYIGNKEQCRLIRRGEIALEHKEVA